MANSESDHAPTAEGTAPASIRYSPFAIRHSPALPITFAFLLLYALTCAPGVLWQDSGMFQFRVWHRDVAGIQGLPLAHPLYILMAKAFCWLPLGPFAFRVNLFSGVCAAIALGILADLLYSLTRSKWSAVCGAVLLGVSHTFWMHAVIAEVYSLYAMALLGELWLMERFFSTRRRVWLFAALFVNGLNLSNHLLAILHWPAYVGIIIWALRTKAVTLRWLPLLPLIVLFGGLQYVALVAAKILAGRPVGDTLAEALVGPPERAEIVLTHTFAIGQLVVRAAQYFVLNFPTPLAILAPMGFWAACRHAEHRRMALFAGGIFVVGFVFAFRYRVPDQFVFYYPCYVIFAFFATLAIPSVARSRALQVICLIFALLPAGIYEWAPRLARDRGLSLGLQREIPYREGYSYFLRPRKNGDDGAERFAREALATAAPNGLLIGDSTIMNAVTYVRDVQGVCPNVALSFASDVRPTAPVLRSVRPQTIGPFVWKRTAYACTDAPAYLPRWLPEVYDLSPVGVVYRIEDKGAARR